MLTPEQRFWAKVDKNGPVPKDRPDLGPCWLWTGSTSGGDGYGRFTDEKHMPAHRWSYRQAYGYLPELPLDHLCVNPSCVRPDHLEAVTTRENVLRSAGVTAINARKTHCIRGHEFTPENTKAVKGGRACRACAVAWELRRRGVRTSRKPSLQPPTQEASDGC